MRHTASFWLLASLAIGSLHADPIQVSGSLYLDAQAPFKPSDAPNNLHVSRARLDFKGQWSPTWSYRIRVDRPSHSFAFENPTAIIPSAVITWKFYDDLVKVNLGKDTSRYSQAGTDSQSYIERSLGILEDSIGQKLGVNVSGVYNKTLGYSFGIWSATARSSVIDYAYSVIPFETDELPLNAENVYSVSNSSDPTIVFSRQRIRPAFGGRINSVILENANFAWGAGLGVQSLDVITPMIATYTNTGSETAYHTTFEKRVACTVDQSVGWKKFTLNSAFHFFKYYRDQSVSINPDLVPEGINVFQRKNQASSGYVELTRLIIGEGYQIDPSCGVVNQVLPHDKYGSVEIAFRAGREYYYNAAAAQFLKNSFNSNSAVPMTFTKEDGYNLITLSENSDQDVIVRALGYTISTSYVMNRNIALKAEYYHIKTSSKANSIWTTLEKEEGLRVRSEFQFG